MKLTPQLIAEMELIQKRCVHLQTDLMTWIGRKSSILLEYEEINRTYLEELIPFKVRLENILCETDIKERGH